MEQRIPFANELYLNLQIINSKPLEFFYQRFIFKSV